MPRWLEQYDRVRRWHERVCLPTDADVNTNADDLYAFFLFCYHLKDWIKNDITVPLTVQKAVEGFVSEEHWLKVAGDLANGVKHLQLKTYRIDPEAHLGVIPGAFQAHAFDEAAFQTRDQVVVVVEGEHHNAVKVANECFIAWSSFLAAHGLM